MNAIKKLTKEQNRVGYVRGNINTIAVLGLFGEAGEVLNETSVLRQSNTSVTIQAGVYVSRLVDNLKKSIRDKKVNNVELFLSSRDEDKFDSEMADVLYYLNALAINRGKTLDEYAEMAYKKVKSLNGTKKDVDISHGSKLNKQ